MSIKEPNQFVNIKRLRRQSLRDCFSKEEHKMASEEAKETLKVVEKEKKKIKPEDKSVDPATIQMLYKAQKEGVETIFDRAETMKPCNIGIQGTCCKMCAQGPCRLPLTKKDLEGKDMRMGLCGATPETIAARNFVRMIAAGAAAHSDHGRGSSRSFPVCRPQRIGRL